MTNEEMLDDLKQYIDLKNTALKDALNNELADELTTTIRDELKVYIKEVVADSTQTILSVLGDKAESTDERIENHETRITKLETRSA